MSDLAWLPALNAFFNAASLSFLLLGYREIKSERVMRHRRMMLSAFTASTIFLVGYLIRMVLTGTHRFPDVGFLRVFYLVLLTTHMLLALVITPFVLRLLYLALKSRFAEHRKIARVVWPLWVYVSSTGIVVYFLLYQVAPRL